MKELKKHIEDCEHIIGNILGFMESNSDSDIISCEENIAVLKEVIIALSEIQQYRAIGTVKELINTQIRENVLNVELESYKEIGTVEEFKALKEKNTIKERYQQKGE